MAGSSTGRSGWYCDQPSGANTVMPVAEARMPASRRSVSMDTPEYSA